MLDTVPAEQLEAIISNTKVPRNAAVSSGTVAWLPGSPGVVAVCTPTSLGVRLIRSSNQGHPAGRAPETTPRLSRNRNQRNPRTTHPSLNRPRPASGLTNLRNGGNQPCLT